MASNTVTLTFAGDARSLDRTLHSVGGNLDAFDRRASSALGRVGRGLATFGTIAAAGLAGAGVAALTFGRDLVSAAEEARAVTKDTSAVIKSMGAQSWTTADAIANLAEKISLKTGLDDEMIQSGENVLLTFRNIRNEVGLGNDVFDRATQAAVDMSARLDKDLSSSMTTLGKALNDPIAGLSALTRVGVQFTDQQRAQIEAMVAAGDTMGAQKIILAELEAQFAGSAEAQASSSDKMKVAWDNLVETLGTYLLPYFDRLTTWITEQGIPWFESFAAKLDERVSPAVSNLNTWIDGSLLPTLQRLWSWLQDEVIPVYDRLVDTLLGEVVPAVQRLLGSVQRLIGTLTNAKSESEATKNALWLLGVLATSSADGLRVMAGAASGVATAISWLIDRVRTVIGWVQRLIDKLNAVKVPRLLGGGKPSSLGFGEAITSGGLGMAVGGFKALFGRAKGGPVAAGRGYLVGEEGPEWFRPSTSGTIIPNGGGTGMAAAGGTTVHVYVQGSIRSDRELVRLIRDEFDRGGFPT